MSIFSTAIFLSVLTLTTTSVHAIEFRVLSWSGSIDNVFYEKTGGDPIALKATESGLSSVYVFTGNGALILYREEQREDRLVRVPVVALSIPSGLKQAILVLSPVDKNGMTYTGLWLDDSPETHRANNIRLQNLSSHVVAIQIAGQNIQLGPEEFQQLPFAETSRRVPMRVAALVGNEWQLVSTAAQPVRAGFHVFVLFRDGRMDAEGTRRAVDLIPLYDYRPAVE